MRTMTKKLIIPLFLLGFLAGFPHSFSNATVQDEINQRQQIIDQTLQEIEQLQQQLDVLGGKSLTLQNEIDTLNVKIKKSQLEIQNLSLSIAQTGGEIIQTQGQVQDAQTKIDLHKSALAKLISIVNQNDQKNLTQIFLKNNRLSDFFNDLASISSTQENIQNILDQIKVLKVDLENKEQQLEDKKGELQNQQTLQQIEKRNADLIKKDRASILVQTNSDKSKLQQTVVRKKRDIEAIRAQISYLLQNGVSAEDVVKFAQLAAIGAGIRPAFLLAELNLESALGGNVGKCYLKNVDNGDGVRIDTGNPTIRNMSPTRDIKPFFSITSSLGLDPLMTRVSCWPKAYSNGQPYGWGGAMGIAQFIPSTWMGYKDRITSITGHSPPNPWNIEDGITAAALKFSKDGAASKTRAGEIAASKRYYCGSATSTNSKCISYANSVQNGAAEIEKNL